MNGKSIYIIITALLTLVACEGVDEIYIPPEPENLADCSNRVIDSGLYYEQEDQSFLWGGVDSSTHFEITDWTLNTCNLKKGLGREAFYALTDPDYELLSETTTNYPDTSRAVIVSFNNTVKVYPFQILRRHETVNEVIDGEPIMVVYCFLADLASVYTRVYCGKTLTFAVSGFTYQDPNAYDAKESFILWDRNSESLWWPINDKAVSGVYKDENMVKYNRGKWGVSTFKEIRDRYPDALVLEFIQDEKELGPIEPSNGCFQD
ncbi:MAG: DUF3179 domain-containing (seleno)protein [Reichenbachiella sp.]|uniref:DUF3179 domain-containing (seleno)protein n=1 Tax=Reichenbachiella sp. TaxID=2184521 RepID=UPI00326560E8